MQTLQTVAEKSDWQKTSLHADVIAFLDLLLASGLPAVDRIHMEEFGKSGEGLSMPYLIVAEPPLADAQAVMKSGKLRLLVNANIHAGEVEGKEAVQILLREFAQGKHASLLEQAVLIFVPIYNPDGNDRIDKKHRASQNEPQCGVGQRANAEGLDLNRDFLKLDSNEARAMLALVNAMDPHLFMDLHTTNGSHHGYHLTYAPSLSTNVDEGIAGYARKTLLPSIRKAMLAEHGFRVYDYGNFSRRGRKSWSTYDHRPRFGSNYHSLRNRFAVLSEAYSYIPYKERVLVTRAFVLETLEAMVAGADEIMALCKAADERCVSGDRIRLGHDTRREDAFEDKILVGSVREEELPDGIGTRLIAEAEFSEVRMPVRVAFVSASHIAHPKAWCFPADLPPSGGVIENLLRHGLVVERVLVDSKDAVSVELFHVTRRRQSRRNYQGQHEVRLSGNMKASRKRVMKGSILIRAAQPLARVAAQLLEAQSEDSLCTWNLIDTEMLDGKPGVYPVMRLLYLPKLSTEILRLPQD